MCCCTLNCELVGNLQLRPKLPKTPAAQSAALRGRLVSLQGARGRLGVMLAHHINLVDVPVDQI
jgi:hypothetical protein